MGNKNRPKLSMEDINLMLKVSKHGFVDMIYVYRFYKVNCKRRTVRERINQLAKHRYLMTINTFAPKEFTASQEAVYTIIALGSRGINLVRNLGEEVEDNSAILKNASPYRMYHQVQVSMICDQIEECFSYGDSKYEVAEILNEKEAFIEESNNMPDAIILFRIKQEYTNEYNKNKYILVFLEIERSYASPRRIRSKLISYENVIRDKIYIKKLGLSIIDQRILFVAQTDGQYETIKNKIAEVEYSYELGVLVSKYSEVCQRPTERIYTNPKNEKTFKLLSNLEVHVNNENK